MLDMVTKICLNFKILQTVNLVLIVAVLWRSVMFLMFINWRNAASLETWMEKISKSVTIHAAACHALGIAALYSHYLVAQMVPEASTPPVWPAWKHFKNPLNTHNAGSS